VSHTKSLNDERLVPHAVVSMMTSINQELYEALIAAGAPDDAAKRAAASVLSHDQRTDLATKADLNLIEERTEGRFRLLQWMIGFNLALTAAVLARLLI
jgi:hypothetical protein